MSDANIDSIENDSEEYEFFGAAPADAQARFKMPGREENENDKDFENRLNEWLDNQGANIAPR